MAWPKNDHAAGISAFWSEQLENDAPDLPALIADAFYSARSKIQKTSRSELLKEVTNLQKAQQSHKTEKLELENEAKANRKVAKELKSANEELLKTISSLRKKMRENIAGRSGESMDDSDGESAPDASKSDGEGGGEEPDVDDDE